MKKEMVYVAAQMYGAFLVSSSPIEPLGYLAVFATEEDARAWAGPDVLVFPMERKPNTEILHAGP